MERFTLFLSIFCFLFVYSEASCWAERGNGYYCKYGKIYLFPGQSYEKTTGPNCFKCTCSEEADMLNCCSVGNIITGIPDTCEIKQVGCNQVAVSKADRSKPCNGPIMGVV